MSCGEGCSLAFFVGIAVAIYFLISRLINKSGLCSLEDGSFTLETRNAMRQISMKEKSEKTKGNILRGEEQPLPQPEVEVLERDPKTGRPTKIKALFRHVRELRLPHND